MPSIGESMENTNTLCYPSFFCLTIGSPISQQRCDVIQKPAREVSRQVQSKVMGGSGPYNRGQPGLAATARQVWLCWGSAWAPTLTAGWMRQAAPEFTLKYYKSLTPQCLKWCQGPALPSENLTLVLSRLGKTLAELWIPVRVNNPKITRKAETIACSRKDVPLEEGGYEWRDEHWVYMYVLKRARKLWFWLWHIPSESLCHLPAKSQPEGTSTLYAWAHLLLSCAFSTKHFLCWPWTWE